MGEEEFKSFDAPYLPHNQREKHRNGSTEADELSGNEAGLLVVDLDKRCVSFECFETQGLFPSGASLKRAPLGVLIRKRAALFCRYD